MKFEVSSANLLKQLSYIDAVVPGNPIIPLLSNFLFDIDNGVLSITASDVQTSIITHLEVNASESGSVAVPAKLLMDTLKNLPEQVLRFEIDEDTYSVVVKSSTGGYKFAGSNPVDYPEMKTLTNGTTIELPGGVLQTGIMHTLFATSVDEMRPALLGVYFKLDDNGITLVATDGHRLVRYIRTDVETGTSSNMLIPKKALNILKNILTPETMVNMTFNEKYAGFSFDSVRMVCRLLDERFPEYQNAIPTENNNVLVAKREEFLSALKIARFFSNKVTRQIRLKLENEVVTISAEDPDMQNAASEKVVCEYEGEEMEIGFNANYLYEVVDNLDFETIKIEMSAPNRAALILPSEAEDSEEILSLVMPVMLTSYA